MSRTDRTDGFSESHIFVTFTGLLPQKQMGLLTRQFELSFQAWNASYYLINLTVRMSQWNDLTTLFCENFAFTF